MKPKNKKEPSKDYENLHNQELGQLIAYEL